ncbi:hypothetical protein HKD37_13G035834 [Glycine soja]
MHITATSQIQLNSLQRFCNENETEGKRFYREEGSAWGPPPDVPDRLPLVVAPGRPPLRVAPGRSLLPPVPSSPVNLSSHATCCLLVKRVPQISVL